MSATLLVNVREGADILDTRQCRSVVLPDGRPGAVWRGLAYPLRPDGSIEVTDSAVPPAACRRPEPAPVRIAHAVIEGAEEAWLVVAGSVADRDFAATRLKYGGIAVLRTGPWLGDPVEGVAADWFVRFARPAGGEPLASLVESLVGAPAASPADAGELRLRLIEAELTSSRAREAVLRHELERTRAANTSATAPPDPEVVALREDLAAERAIREATEVALADATRALVDAQTAAEATRTTQRSASPARPQGGGGRRIADEVETVLSTLLPAVRLLRDGLTVVSAEFRERGGLYRALAELQPPPARLPAAWKKLQGVDGWWERHVGTGEDDAGRVYARWEAVDRRWAALVSHKGEQAHDIAWLRRQ